MKILPIVAWASLLPAICLAQSNREQDAHDHGAGSLNVAIDEASLYIEFDAPWDNLVGFEHKPSTSEQNQLVEVALANLQSADELFSFNGVDCRMDTVDITNSMAQIDEEEDHGEEHEAEDHEDSHSEDAHSDDKHSDEEHSEDSHSDDEHSDDEHSEDSHSDDEHSDDEHSEETHSAVFAQYKFDCDNIASLTSIDLSIFNVWDRFEELDVQAIGPRGAISIELTADNANLDLTAVN